MLEGTALPKGLTERNCDCASLTDGTAGGAEVGPFGLIQRFLLLELLVAGRPNEPGKEFIHLRDG